MDTPHLLLLHGALGSGVQFAPFTEHLNALFNVHAFDFEGHGSRSAERPFQMKNFVENVFTYLDSAGIERCSVFGYSMGGYVGLLCAAAQPRRIAAVQTLATKFRWSPEIAEREMRFLDPEGIKSKVPQFAAILEKRHSGQGWENVVRQTREVLRELGERPLLNGEVLASLRIPVRICLGDSDTMVSLEESHEAFTSLPQSEFEVFPATQHPLETVSPNLLAASIMGFRHARM